MKSFLPRFPAGMLLMLLFSQPANSAWVKTNGPSGGNIISVAKIGSVIFAGSTGGAFFSLDGAGTWTEASGLAGHVVSCFSGIGNYFFAGTGDGIFRSADNGATWSFSNQGVPGDNGISALLTSGATLIAGSDSGIFRSTDTGKTWSAATSGLIGKHVNCCAVNNGTVFAGTNTGLFSSTDNGATWSATSSVMNNRYIYSLAAGGNRLFAGTQNDGVFRSIDNGLTWTPVNSGLADSSTALLAADGDNLILQAGNNIYLSRDAADSWTPLNPDVPAAFPNLNSAVISGNTILVGSFFGFFRSNDIGATWVKADQGITNSSIYKLVSSGNNIIAGTLIHGVAVSGDRGATWSESDMNFYYTNVQSLVADGAFVFAGTDIQGAFFSSDNGTSWAPLHGSVDYIPYRFLTVHNGTIFAEISGKLSRSSDNGAGWTAIPEDFYLSCLIGNGTGLYAGSNSLNVYRSIDNGVSWSLFIAGKKGEYDYVNDLAVIADTLIAGSSTGIYRATGNGAGWVPVKSDSITINCFATSGDAIFAGSAGGVLLSLDNGVTWNAVNTGLADSAVSCLAVHNDVLYAGIWQGGVWCRPVVEMTRPTGTMERRVTPGKINAAVFSARRGDTHATVTLTLASAGRTALAVFAISGREIVSLVNRHLKPGRYQYRWNTRNVAPGFYLLKLTTEAGTSVKSIPVLRH